MAGQADPLKFGLVGDFGLDILVDAAPQSRAVTCGSGTPTCEIDGTNSVGTGLRYDTGSQLYIFVWKTGRGWAGTCRELVLNLKDGSSHRLMLAFR